MHDESWVYRCTVRDINVHTGDYYFTCENPQHEWQKNGLTLNAKYAPEMRVGDKVTIKYQSTHYSGYYVVTDIEPTDNPGTPTYEIVNEGRWYDKYLCCSKAYQGTSFCVCRFRLVCPVHTNGAETCIGSHD